MADVQVPSLRKMDFWASLVLIAASIAMLLQTLSFPLRGTYAGVKNAWYVSPALFPLIISSTLIVLGLLLLARAVHAGGAAAALGDLRRSAVSQFLRASAAFWIIGGAIAAYVYGFIPHVDFVAATALFLLGFTSGFHLAESRASGLLLAGFIAGGAVLLMASLGATMPGPQTVPAYALDAGVWAAFGVAASVVFATCAGDSGLRRRFLQCFWTSLVTAVLLGVVFKYGLLVPLPREGITVVLTDQVVYALRAAL